MAEDYLSFIRKLATAPLDAETLAKVSNLAEFQTDPLTGMPDYRAFSLRLQQWCNTKPEFTLAAIAIDHLQEINLLSSWIVGDIAICGVAKALQASLRDSDVAGRISGGMFMAAFANDDLTATQTWVKELSGVIATYELPDIDLLPEGCLTISTGICRYSPDDGNAELLQLKARKRLDYAKQQGGNTIAMITGDGIDTESFDLSTMDLRCCRVGESGWQTGDLLQLSQNGLSFGCNAPFLVREAVDIALTPPERTTIELRSQVSWRQTAETDDPFAFVMGIKFPALSEEQTEHLHAILAEGCK